MLRSPLIPFYGDAPWPWPGFLQKAAKGSAMLMMSYVWPEPVSYEAGFDET